MKIKWLTVLMLFWVGTMLAQSSAIQLTATQQRLNQSEIKETVSILIDKAYDNGFSIQLSNASAIVPIVVTLSGENLWLKKDNDSNFPAKVNQLHWQSQDNRLQIVFAAGTLHAGQTIEIELRAFAPEGDASISNVYLYSLSRTLQNHFVPDGLLKQVRTQELK